jgi:hypothetical protein
MEKTSKTIFFHVGTSKTGSTFLQNRIFPLLKGIAYIPTNKYRNIYTEIEKIKQNSILVSREFDRQFEEEIEKFSNNYINVTPIIVFRRHDQYLASQYRRFIKNGYRGEINAFFDLENDAGYFKKVHFNYSYQINYLSQKFNQKPLVLFYDSLKENPEKFVLKLSQHLNSSLDVNTVNFNKKHGSYNEKQLKVIKTIGNVFNLRKRRIFKSELLHLMWRFYHAIFRYSILYGAVLVPNFMTSKTPLIDSNYLERVRKYFEDDWNNCKKYSS